MGVLTSNGKIEIVDLRFDNSKPIYGSDTPFSLTIKNKSGVTIKNLVALMTFRFHSSSTTYKSGETAPLAIWGSIEYPNDPYNYVTVPQSISIANNKTYTFTGIFKFVGKSLINSPPDLTRRELSYESPGYETLSGLYISFSGNSGLNSGFFEQVGNLQKHFNISFLNTYYVPTIASFNGVRSLDGKENDEGEDMLTTFKLGLKDRTYYDALSLMLYYKEKNEDAYKDINLSEWMAQGLDSVVTMTIKSIFSKSVDWDVTLQYGDQYENASATIDLSKAFANLHLSGKSTGGACFGGFSKAEEGAPLLQSYYPAIFYEGIEGGFTYVSEEVDTGGKWIDGKRIYRSVLHFITTLSGAGGVVANLPDAPETLISARGFFSVSGSNSIRPIPFCQFNDIQYSVNLNVSKNSTDISMTFGTKWSGSKDVYLILEYTKVDKEGS